MTANVAEPSRVAVVVLNYNGLDDTLKCLESLNGVSDLGDVILVDNASRVDPTGDATRVRPTITALRTTENLGYAGGNNRGIERAIADGAEYVLVLNNDTIVAPHIVRALVNQLESDPSLGIVGPVVNFMDEPDVVMTDGFAFNPGPGTEFFRRIVVPVGATSTPVEVDLVNGCCMMVRASVIRAVGAFDEQFFIIHEESDLCLRALRAGFRCAVLGETLVWHKGSSSFKRSGRQLQRYFDTRNLFHLLMRHSGRVSRSRGRAVSLVHWMKYAFYRYDVERDAGAVPAADAVVEGFYDALRGRFGPYAANRRPGLGLVRSVFSVRRWLAGVTRGRQPAEPEGRT